MTRCVVTIDVFSRSDPALCMSNMKRKVLERELSKLGWWRERHGSNHDIWTDGKKRLTVPRYQEVNELTAKGILRKARGL